jgi:N12 class adenine-specific DNA methylase
VDVLESPYSENVRALEAVQPEDIGPDDIAVRIGTVWIPSSDYVNFLEETLKPGRWQNIAIEHREYDNTWKILNKPSGYFGSSSVLWKKFTARAIKARGIFLKMHSIRN